MIARSHFVRCGTLAFVAALALPQIAVAADGPSGGTDVLARVRATGVLRVGLTGDYDPFSVVDASGTFRGMDVDAAAALAKAIGPDVKVQIVKTAWPTMTADLTADKFDIAMGGVSRNKARGDAGELSQTYLRDGKVALVRASDRARFATLADFDKPGVTVIVNPGGTNDEFVKANMKSAKVVTEPDNRAIPGLVASGKGDVMFTDGVEALLAAKRDPRLAVVNDDKPYTNIEKVYYVGKGQTALRAFVDRWIDAMNADGAFGTLFAKYAV